MVLPETGRPGEPPLTLADLREMAVFGGLADGLLESFAGGLRTKTFAPGDTVCSEGDKGACLFVLLSGEVEVLKRSRTGVEHRVAVLGPRDSFGEMSLIDMHPRSATVRTIAPARVLRISSEDFDRLYRQDMKAYALLVLNIARDLSRRLRIADGILADVAGAVVDRYGRPPSS